MSYTKRTSKGSPFSMDSRVSQIAECSGLNQMGYPDTQQSIYVAQEESTRKVKASMSKAGENQRN